MLPWWGLFDAADDFVDVGDAVGVEPGVDAVDDFYGDGGVEEVGGADLDGGGAYHKEFEGVGGVTDAAESYDGDVDGLGYLADHAEGDGLDAGTADASGTDAEVGAAALDVDAHAHKGVDKGDGVGAFGLDSTGDGGDVGDVGGELDDEGFVVSGTDGFYDRGGAFTAGAEGHAAVTDIGAGDIELDGVDMFEGVDAGGALGIVFGA